jgi:hypothetical protein
MAVPIFVDRLTIFDQPTELRDGQIRPLTWAIDGEEAQRHRFDVVKVAVIRAHLLTCHLRHRIGADGLQDWVLLSKGHLFIDPVNRGTAGKDKMLAPCLTRGFQEIEGAFDIGVDVKLRLHQSDLFQTPAG